MMTEVLRISVFIVAVLGAVYAVFNFTKVKALDEGTVEMSEIV